MSKFEPPSVGESLSWDNGGVEVDFREVVREEARKDKEEREAMEEERLQYVAGAAIYNQAADEIERGWWRPYAIAAGIGGLVGLIAGAFTEGSNSRSSK